jgi:hypothetical protein
MTIKKQLLEEIESTSDTLLTQTLCSLATEISQKITMVNFYV